MIITDPPAGAGDLCADPQLLMRTSLLLPLLLLVPTLHAQSFGDRRLVLEETPIAGMPGIQSFAWAQHQGQWLLIGGRTDGLHRRQPFAAFLAADNNTMAHVVDPVSGTVWSASLASLPAAQFEQLQSTNMEFMQQGDVLYVVGGYGFSATANDHITHPLLSAIDVPGAMEAIRTGGALAPHFRYITDERLAVTGGYLGRIGAQYVLVGGQRFIGRYNPMGPDFGPGFIQEYTNAIRRFGIADDGQSLGLIDYSATVDTVNLHRRDYNLVPQVFPDGSFGYHGLQRRVPVRGGHPLVEHSGCERHRTCGGARVRAVVEPVPYGPCAAVVASTQRMSTVFFGGIGRYYFDGNGQLWDDVNVPFVNTISQVTRDGAGQLQETAIGTMPALLGSSAEFIRLPEVPMVFDDIVDLDQLSGDTVVIGHIVGGIESSAANIFFINTGTQSTASTRTFRVLLVRDTNVGVREVDRASEPLLVTLSPDHERMSTGFTLATGGHVQLELLDTNGRRVNTLFSARLPAGTHLLHHTVKDLAPGVYVVDLQADGERRSARFVR
jgi:hypothetical protein